MVVRGHVVQNRESVNPVSQVGVTRFSEKGTTEDKKKSMGTTLSHFFPLNYRSSGNVIFPEKRINSTLSLYIKDLVRIFTLIMLCPTICKKCLIILKVPTKVYRKTCSCC